MRHFPIRSHTDEQLGLVDADGVPAYVPPNPFNWPRATLGPRKQPAPRAIELPAVESVEPDPLGEIVTPKQLTAIYREHFRKFDSHLAAARHYHVSKGRISQLVTGRYLNCRRVLGALGIVQVQGVFRRVAIGIQRDGEIYRRVL